jgi:hypothetical protein
MSCDYNADVPYTALADQLPFSPEAEVGHKRSTSIKQSQYLREFLFSATENWTYSTPIMDMAKESACFRHFCARVMKTRHLQRCCVCYPGASPLLITNARHLQLKKADGSVQNMERCGARKVL